MGSRPKTPKSKKKKPSPRRDGREAAVQFLFGHDVQESSEVEASDIKKFWELRHAKDFARDFATELIQGTLANLSEIDETIRSVLENYKLHRLTLVDRNILRLGVYEMCFSDHIPPPAALNEAIEIAKRFGTEDSPRFVNGILDKILKNKDSR